MYILNFNFPFLSLSLSLSCTHAHTHTHTKKVSVTMSFMIQLCYTRMEFLSSRSSSIYTARRLPFTFLHVRYAYSGIHVMHTIVCEYNILSRTHFLSPISCLHTPWSTSQKVHLYLTLHPQNYPSFRPHESITIFSFLLDSFNIKLV